MDSWEKFKRQIGLVILYAAICYGVMVTLVLLVFGHEACKNQPLWAFLTNIVSTVLGWLLAKAGTVVDHQFGTSRSGEEAAGIFIKREEAIINGHKKQVPGPGPDDGANPGPGGVRDNSPEPTNP